MVLFSLLSTAIAICVLYLAATLMHFGRVPKSISDTYYQWQAEELGWLFIIFLFSVSFLAVAPWIEVMPDQFQFIAFLGSAGLAFVGAACAFKQKLTKAVHYSGAGTWAAAVLASAVILHGWAVILVGALVAAIPIAKGGTDKALFWLEVGCVVIMVAIIITGLCNYY